MSPAGTRERTYDAAAGADGLRVSAAVTSAEMSDGLEFCAQRYDEAYESHWVDEPDVLFVARRGERIVSTAALEFGSRRPQIDLERYFRLSPSMRSFIDSNRSRIAEFGRFASLDHAGTKAVVQAMTSRCAQAGVDFLFAYAVPAVYTYVEREVGLPSCAFDVPVDDAAVRSDTSWTAPPAKLFFREDVPRLLVTLIPFVAGDGRSLAIPN